MKLNKKTGRIHIYTGDGKGKTTASLGLALRAIGAGKKVAIVQFLKKKKSSEHQAIKKYNLPIIIESFGLGFYKIGNDTKTSAQHQKAAQKAINRALEIIKNQSHDILILDEVNLALDYDLIEIDQVVQIIDLNQQTEIILTGRNAPLKLKKLAHLVTEMKKYKHYFDQGHRAKKGIEY